MIKYSQATHPHSKLTQQIIGIAIKIHKQLGPGFREKYYQRAMYLELQRTNLKFEREKKIRIPYGKITLGYHIIDFIIENKIIVELKSMKSLTDVEIGQLTTYLKLTGCEIGLLLNFGQPTLEIKRVKI
ncbi:GxxExxY protein [Candidatus Microgenomates bacterium]|nr:GxxExxY protein [Candidatus Microgenomates bacterium]